MEFGAETETTPQGPMPSTFGRSTCCHDAIIFRGGFQYPPRRRDVFLQIGPLCWTIPTLCVPEQRPPGFQADEPRKQATPGKLRRSGGRGDRDRPGHRKNRQAAAGRFLRHFLGILDAGVQDPV